MVIKNQIFLKYHFLLVSNLIQTFFFFIMKLLPQRSLKVTQAHYYVQNLILQNPYNRIITFLNLDLRFYGNLLPLFYNNFIITGHRSLKV